MCSVISLKVCVAFLSMQVYMALVRVQSDEVALREAVASRIGALVPASFAGYLRLMEQMQRWSQVPSVQLVLHQLRNMLTSARPDGSNFQRDVAAVSLLRSMHRAVRYCGEFARVVSQSGSPFVQDALRAVSSLEVGFVEPLRTAVSFDRTGRVVACRPDLSPRYFEACTRVLNEVLDDLNVPQELREAKGLARPFGNAIVALYTMAPASSSGGRDCAGEDDRAIASQQQLAALPGLRAVTRLQRVLQRELGTVRQQERTPLALVQRGVALQVEMEGLLAGAHVVAAPVDLAPDVVQQLKVQLQSWLARLLAFKAAVSARNELTAQKERVWLAWHRLNPLVLEAALGIADEFQVASSGQRMGPEAVLLQQKMDAVEAVCGSQMETAFEGAESSAMLRQAVKFELLDRAWESAVVHCIRIAAGAEIGYVGYSYSLTRSCI
jgi:hypothetical protein